MPNPYPLLQLLFDELWDGKVHLSDKPSQTEDPDYVIPELTLVKSEQVIADFLKQTHHWGMTQEVTISVLATICDNAERHINIHYSMHQAWYDMAKMIFNHPHYGELFHVLSCYDDLPLPEPQRHKQEQSIESDNDNEE